MTPGARMMSGLAETRRVINNEGSAARSNNLRIFYKPMKGIPFLYTIYLQIVPVSNTQFWSFESL